MLNIDVLSMKIGNKIISKSNITLIISIDNCHSSLEKIKFFK